MKVTVTAEDIEKGVPSVLDACPVALAIYRAFGSDPSVGVNVDESEVYVFSEDDGSTIKFWEMPHPIGEIIAHYDNTGEMDPFGFEL